MIYSWYILGEILHALPNPLAIATMKDPDTKDTLRNAADPRIDARIHCMRLLCIF